MEIFLPLLKANQAPFHSNITLWIPLKFALCHVPLDLSLVALISRFRTPIEYLCFSFISTDVFPFSLNGILASCGRSRFLTCSPYVCFCGLGGHSPLRPLTTLRKLTWSNEAAWSWAQSAAYAGSLLTGLASYRRSHPESLVDEPAFPLKASISGNPLKCSC